MKNPPAENRQPFVTGADHRTCGLSVRDRLFVEDADVPAMLARLCAEGIEQAMVLSTCDRVEIMGHHAQPEQAARKAREILAGHAGMTRGELTPQVYFKSGEVAVRHIFAVASSLDSQVVGEPQVLGQVKAAHRMAQHAGIVLGGFDGLLQAAYGVAKRVRTETAIGERPVSIAAAGLDIARGLHGDLSRTGVLLIGVGELGELIAGHFREHGIGHLGVYHPIASRATPLARQLDCHVIEEPSLPEALAAADIVICAMGRRRHTLSTDMVNTALKVRRRKPQFIVDTGIPGDVEPAAHRIDDAFVYDTEDLERVALDGKANREKEARHAELIVDEEVHAYMKAHRERDAVPVVSALRRHFAEVRETALAEAGGDAERASELMINRLLDGPSRKLREAADQDNGEELEKAALDLFNLQPPSDEETPK